MTLEDLEGEGGISNDVGEEKGHEEEEKEGSQVFLKLVETMKASGNLPEKPTPTVCKWTTFIAFLPMNHASEEKPLVRALHVYETPHYLHSSLFSQDSRHSSSSSAQTSLGKRQEQNDVSRSQSLAISTPFTARGHQTDPVSCWLHEPRSYGTSRDVFL